MVIMANFYEQVTNILCVYTEKIPEIYVSGLYFGEKKLFQVVF